MSAGNHVAMTRCFFCGEGSTILLHKRLGDVSAFHDKVVDMEPCTKCRGFMEMGVILIAIDDEKSDKGWNIPPDMGSRDHGRWMPNPYRTGGFFVVTDSFIQRVFSPKALTDQIIKMRWTFIDHVAAEKLGLTKTEEAGPG